jgi:DNA sulfur modification protein DndD|tara:strand:- start:2389 stop:4350 length:1962 start_codon:yes stop_codon:yes gene_type:complete
MRLDLVKWESAGLRCPDFDIDIEKNGEILPTLLQMPNGTGKTTTLDLLKCCMYNHEFTTREIQEYKAKGNEYKEKGFFQAKLKLDSEIFYIKISFDFKNNKASYSSSLSSGGWKPELILPTPLDKIIDKGLVDLLFIDLEKCEKLFRKHLTEAQDAIRKFCKITILNRIISDLDEHKKRARNIATPRGSVEINIATEEARNKDINLKYNEIKKQEEKCKKFLNDTEDKFTEYDLIIREKLEKDDQLKKRREELETKKNKAEALYQNALLNNFNKIKIIGTYGGNLEKNLTGFVEGLDKLQLPEAEARVFFEELLERDHCICGEELNEKRRQNILKEKEKFISIDAARIVAEIKNSVKIHISENQKTNLDEVNKVTQKFKHEYDSLIEDLKLITTKTFKDDMKIWDDYNKLKKERGEKEYFLSVTIKKPWKSIDNESNTESLISLKTQKELSDKRLAELTGTQDIEKKVKFLINILDSSKEEAEMKISKELTDECNNKIKKMLSKDPVYIESIEKHIIFKDQQSKGSTGQEARIGIIFLLTILDRSLIKFPLVVDTPVKGMDFAGRRRTAKFISDLKSQFIGFVIDSDKEDFSDKLKEFSNNKANFITSYRRHPEFDKLASEFQMGPKNSGNSHVVYDYNFFNKFKEETDPDEL